MRGMRTEYKKLGELIKGARMRAGISREDATMMLGLSNRNFLCNCENGLANFPASKLVRAMDVLGVKRVALIEAIIEDEVKGLEKFLKGAK